MSRQTIRGWFPRLTPGSVWAKIPVVRILIRLINIAETIEGMDGIEIIKPLHMNGCCWKIRLDRSASVVFPPEGWEEREVTLFTGAEKLECTILVKSDTETVTNITSTAYASTDKRLLLQVVDGDETGTYKLDLARGYFKA